MADPPDELLKLRIGGRTVGENLRRAIAAGEVREAPDGSLTLALGRREPPLTVTVYNRPQLGCLFLNEFLFKRVYARATVPKGCEHCYKVKVFPRTLRELVALYEIARETDGVTKVGIDFKNRHSQSFYAAYFYVSGLPAARARYREVRRKMDAHPKLGADVPMVIKRGCSNYEAACGPSDQYTFPPELAEIEAYLKTRFRLPPPWHKSLVDVLFATWVPYAFQVGDDTYLDFTEGRRLYPKTVTYDPEENPESTTAP